MPRDLFDDRSNSATRVGGRKWYTLPLSIAAHTVVIATILIIPLTPDSMPGVPSMMTFVAAAPAPPTPPPPRAAGAPPATPTVQPNPNAAPLTAPTEIAPESGITPSHETGADGGVAGGVPGGLIDSVVDGLPQAPPPPPKPTAVRVGSGIKSPVKIRDVRPVYPAIAQAARVQGVVIIEATIGPNGRVTDATLLRSIPLLDRSALDAVRQWEYTPTLLNGVPVAVIMTVTVQFTLQ